MKQIFKFKTNINCGNCVAKVKPFLDKVEGMANWSVDTDSDDKILTTEVSDKTTREQVIDAVENVGFDIEKI